MAGAIEMSRHPLGGLRDIFLQYTPICSELAASLRFVRHRELSSFGVNRARHIMIPYSVWETSRRAKCDLKSILNRADLCTGFRAKLSRERGNTHSLLFPPRVLYGFPHGAKTLGWI